MTYAERQKARQAKVNKAISLTGSNRETESGFFQFDFCPFCGFKEKVPRRVAGVDAKTGGFKCFLCTTTMIGVDEFLNRMNIPVDQRTIPATVVKHERRREGLMLWQLDPMRYHAQLTNAPELVERWQSYKPISHDMILKYQLGYGLLPPIKKDADGTIRYTQGCTHPRLVYANIENVNRQPVAFRGRQLACSCKNRKPGDLKWLTITGGKAWLFNARAVEQSRGASIIIVEQPTDAILVMQAMPDVIAVAGTAGAGTWRAEWTKLIVQAQPASILQWLDNDLAGNPNEETREIQIAERIEKYRQKNMDVTPAMIQSWRESSGGPKIVAQFQAYNAPIGSWQWPTGTPTEMDAGQYLINEGAVHL